MIYKITVYDNDFFRVIEEFLHEATRLLHVIPSPNLKEDFFTYSEYRKDTMDRVDLLSYLFGNGGVDIIKGVQTSFIIKECFELFIQDHESKDYLMEHLTIKQVNEYKEEWENAEVFYWFPSKNTFFAQ